MIVYNIFESVHIQLQLYNYASCISYISMLDLVNVQISNEQLTEHKASLIYTTVSAVTH